MDLQDNLTTAGQVFRVSDEGETAIGVKLLILAHHISRQNIFIVIGLIWLNSIFWSGSPLLGWGSYRVRRYGTCEIDWGQARFSVSYKLYVILILLVNFSLPISVIVFTYVSIIRTVNATYKSSHGEVSERQRKIEKAITKISLLVCAAFLLAWSLYAAISVWSALGCAVPPLLTGLLATLSAKSASFYNPLIYVGLSSKFGSDLCELFRCVQRPASLQMHSPKPPLPTAAAAAVGGEGGWGLRGGHGRISIGDSVPPAMEVSVGGEEEERHGGGGKQEMGQQETDCAQSCVLLNILP